MALATVPAQAQTIFKCTDPAGNIEYRNSACPSGTEVATLDMPLAAGTMLEIRPSSDQRSDGETRIVRERPVRAPQPAAPIIAPAAPVNALPPPPTPAEARK
jgi:hypothetical protein